jgi:hypothetical protein
VRQSPLVLKVIALTLGILSVVPGIRAAELSKVDTNSNGVDEPLTFDIRAAVGLPFQTTQNLTLGTESPAEAAETDIF